jgi:PAS domain S-box-containing protein
MIHKHQEEQETRFDHMFAHSLVGAGLMDISGSWLRSNAEFTRIIGYAEHELSNMTLSASNMSRLRLSGS